MYGYKFVQFEKCLLHCDGIAAESRLLGTAAGCKKIHSGRQPAFYPGLTQSR